MRVFRCWRRYIFVGGDSARFTTEGDPCLTGDLHGKVKRRGMWMQQILPMPIHMIFDEAYRKAGRIGHATADWDVSHGNLYDWSDDNLREVEKGRILTTKTPRALAAISESAWRLAGSPAETPRARLR